MDCRKCEYYIQNQMKHYCYRYRTFLNASTQTIGKVTLPAAILPCCKCIEENKGKLGKDHSYEYDQVLNRAPYRGLCFTCCNGNKCERPEVYVCPNYVWRGISGFEEV